MTGERDVFTNWDEDGNYIQNGIRTKEKIRNRFSTLEEAISYAVNNEYSYITM